MIILDYPYKEERFLKAFGGLKTSTSCHDALASEMRAFHDAGT